MRWHVHFRFKSNRIHWLISDPVEKVNQPARVPGEEGLRDVKIMMAIHEAARTGQEIQLT